MSNADLSALTGRIAVVTGATRGIGEAVALALAAHGATLVAVGRKVADLEALDDKIRAAGGEAATLVPIDVTDGPGIDRLGAAIAERWGRLDILVGNAGVLGRIAPLTHIPAPVWQEAFDVNLSANWRLLRTLHPVLRRSEAGRCVFITSGAARSLRANWGAYSISKLALEALVRTYAQENAGTPVRANLFSPGPVATRMRASAMPGEDPATLPSPADVAPQILALCLPSEQRNGEVVAFAKEAA